MNSVPRTCSSPSACSVVVPSAGGVQPTSSACRAQAYFLAVQPWCRTGFVACVASTVPVWLCQRSTSGLGLQCLVTMQPGTCHGDEGALADTVQRPGVRPVLGEGAVHEPRAARQRRKLQCRVLSCEPIGILDAGISKHLPGQAVGYADSSRCCRLAFPPVSGSR